MINPSNFVSTKFITIINNKTYLWYVWSWFRRTTFKMQRRKNVDQKRQFRLRHRSQLFVELSPSNWIILYQKLYLWNIYKGGQTTKFEMTMFKTYCTTWYCFNTDYSITLKSRQNWRHFFPFCTKNLVVNSSKSNFQTSKIIQFNTSSSKLLNYKFTTLSLVQISCAESSFFIMVLCITVLYS